MYLSMWCSCVIPECVGCVLRASQPDPRNPLVGDILITLVPYGLVMNLSAMQDII